ncbi:DUF3500 domain-containing protein [Rhodococcus wratislaviensis]|uniref:DUF3500 domain-containing protein n=1 Tax=Rhodococcus wratislaviensis TaxID=44752 RepID=UPI00366A0CE5
MAAERNFAVPFTGITNDGTPRKGLFERRATGADLSSAVDAARAYLAALDIDGRAAGNFPMAAPEWRRWTNAFPTWEPHGVLLDDLSPERRKTAVAVIRACLSSDGYGRVRTLMKLNAALGELIDDYRDSLREWMYRFTIFGNPGDGQPWGWQLVGHHLDVHCVLVGDQMVLTPTFMGAEPVELDDGPYRGLSAFGAEAETALELVNSLNANQRDRVVLFPSMDSDALPAHLQHPTEGRMRGGFGADNLVLPFEGLSADSFNRSQKSLLLELIGLYVDVAPQMHADARMREIAHHLPETHVSWVGGLGPDDAFYYRIHSPVILIEFDHHRGVFLANDEPRNFHVHTVVRTPNGNDYGRDLLRQHYAVNSHGNENHHSH